MKYLVLVRPQGTYSPKQYLFTSKEELKVGQFCNCHTRIGKMFGKVTACVKYGQTERERKMMNDLIKALVPSATFPLKEVLSYFEEYLITENDEDSNSETPLPY